MKKSPHLFIHPLSSFPLENIPFGVFSSADNVSPRCCTRIGDYVVDLSVLAFSNVFNGVILKDTAKIVFAQPVLNSFIKLGTVAWSEARSSIQFLFSNENDAYLYAIKKSLYPICDRSIVMHLPVTIGDYTDFYASMDHASNVGKIFRGPENALPPNWIHMPIGYHGRSSSIVISGTPIIRPSGQIKPRNGDPIFGSSEKLDVELEMAFIIGKENLQGIPIPIEEAKDYIFGMVLLNDWSARDIQSWEYVPLGPFVGKNFATSISPWIITLEALEPFLSPKSPQVYEPLPYLREKNPLNYDISLEMTLSSKSSSKPIIICRTNLQNLYWSICQQLTHHTISGCNMRVGDLCGTGTISGPEPESYGSLLERSWNGTVPFKVGDETRTFLEDDDLITITGVCQNENLKIGFGECTGKILPAIDFNFFQ